MTMIMRRRFGAALLCMAAVCTVSLRLAAQQPKPEPAQPEAAKPTEPAKPAEPPKPAEYVGSETCQACHEDAFKAFQRNPHNLVEKDKRRGWEGKACESCHGPGSNHAESASATDIFNPDKAPAGRSDQNCLKCHLNQPSHIGRIRSGHAEGQVACASCHSIHKGAEAMRPHQPAGVNAQCASCHTSTWAQFNRPHAHRLREGAMSCTDCHNPHGSFQPRMLQAVAANEPGCIKCHGDKRGPFVYEHAPVKLEGCATCHEPHGSANPRMLTRHEVRFQCLECHSNTAAPQRVGDTAVAGGIPPAFHDLLSPRFRNCTICHIKVHGSHVSRDFLR
jgi:DmsE family decaheme c-type cytochrome